MDDQETSMPGRVVQFGMGLCDPEAECFGNYTLTRRTEEENDEVECQVEGWKATKFKAVAVRLNLWP